MAKKAQVRHPNVTATQLQGVIARRVPIQVGVTFGERLSKLIDGLVHPAAMVTRPGSRGRVVGQRSISHTKAYADQRQKDPKWRSYHGMVAGRSQHSASPPPQPSANGRVRRMVKRDPNIVHRVARAMLLVEDQKRKQRKG